MELSELWESLKNANYLWVLFSLVFAIVAYISRAYRWKLLIEPLGYNVSTKNTFYSLMIGYLANFAFPRIGEITRCATLNKVEKAPLDKLIGTVILERICDLLILIVLLVFIFIFRIDKFGKFLNEHIFSPFTHKIDAVLHISPVKIVLTACILLIMFLCVFLFRQRLKKIKPVVKVFDFFKGIFTGFKTIIHMKKFRAFMLHTLIIWVMYFLMTYVLFFATVPTSVLMPIDGLFILVISAMGMSAPVQGGIGAFHWIVTLGLTLYGINREDGLVYATISHTSQAIFAILLGVFSIIILFINRKKNKEALSGEK